MHVSAGPLLPNLRSIKVRIFDHGKTIAEWIEDTGDFDSASHFLNRVQKCRSESKQPFQLGLGVFDSPVDLYAGRAWIAVRHQSQFESPNRESDIKRFVKVGFLSQNLAIPQFRLRKVGRWVDGSSKSENHDCDDGSVLCVDVRWNGKFASTKCADTNRWMNDYTTITKMEIGELWGLFEVWTMAVKRWESG